MQETKAEASLNKQEKDSPKRVLSKPTVFQCAIPPYITVRKLLLQPRQSTRATQTKIMAAPLKDTSLPKYFDVFPGP